MKYVDRITRQLSSSESYFLSRMKLFQALWTFALTFVDDTVNDNSKPLPQNRFHDLISQFSQSHHPSQEVSKVNIPLPQRSREQKMLDSWIRHRNKL